MNNDLQYLRYVKNTNGGATKDNFVEDWEPIGEMVWHGLLKQGLVTTRDGRIYLTEAGRAAIAT